MGQTNKRDIEEAAIVVKTARLCGVSKRYVRMVRNNDRTNEKVLSVYMGYLEETLKMDNKMIDVVKELVPIPGTDKPKQISKTA